MLLTRQEMLLTKKLAGEASAKEVKKLGQWNQNSAWNYFVKFLKDMGMPEDVKAHPYSVQYARNFPPLPSMQWNSLLLFTFNFTQKHSCYAINDFQCMYRTAHTIL